MSETTTTTAAPATPKTEKVVAKKPAAKKAPKPSVNGKALGTPAGDRKRELVKVLRRMGAVKAGSAASLKAAAAKLGVEAREVYGLACGTAGKACSSPTCLVATGHAKIAEHEDGLAVYLTAKGIKTLFDDRPFVRG